MNVEARDWQQQSVSIVLHWTRSFLLFQSGCPASQSVPSLRLQIRPALSAFTWVLRTQTQVLMLGQPAFYLQSLLSSSWNNFNTMFSICIYLVWVYSQFSLERLKTHFGGRCWLNSWRWDVWRTLTWFWCFIKASYYLSMYTYISLFTKIPNYLCAL